MPDPTSSVSHRDISWPELPTERDDFRETLARRADEGTYGVCREPATVIGAALCDDATALSNACRRAQPDSLDDVLCDNQLLERAERFCANVAQKAVELLLGSKMGRFR